MKKQLDKGTDLIRVGLRWDCDADNRLDLDLSAFLLDEKGLARSDADFVFYNNPVSEDEALVYSGDDRNGIVDGTNESIFVDLNKIPQNVQKAVFCVTFDESEDERFFGEAESVVLNACAVTDPFDKGGEPFCSVDLAADHSQSSSMAVLELSRADDAWSYEMVCESAEFGMIELCSRYGLAVE